MNGGSALEFNEKLKELRSSRGLTQEELAEALFVQEQLFRSGNRAEGIRVLIR